MAKLNNITVTVVLDDSVLREQLKLLNDAQAVLSDIEYFSIYLANHKDESDTLKYKNHMIAVKHMFIEYQGMLEKLIGKR